MNSDNLPLYVYTFIEDMLRKAHILFELLQGNSMKWVSIYL